MSDVWKFIQENALALVALMQVWIIAAWRKWLIKPKLVVVFENNVEVGLSSWGPYIRLYVNLHSSRKQIFIKSMNLELVRLKDNFQHSFRSFAYGSLNLSEVALELPSSFLLTPSTHETKNVIFLDVDLERSLEQKLEKYSNKWDMFRRKTESEAMENEKERKEYVMNSLESFTGTEDYQHPFEFLSENFFWHQGEYEITLEIQTLEPQNIYEKVAVFELTEEHSKKLKQNINTILWTPISDYLYEYEPPYYRAFTTLEEI